MSYRGEVANANAFAGVFTDETQHTIEGWIIKDIGVCGTTAHYPPGLEKDRLRRRGPAIHQSIKPRRRYITNLFIVEANAAQGRHGHRTEDGIIIGAENGHFLRHR